MAIVTACASSANAIGEATETIRRGAADAILAGGAEAGLVPLALAGFNVMTAISRRNDAPQKASRPFDLHRDGFVPGEGAAALVLENLDHAGREARTSMPKCWAMALLPMRITSPHRKRPAKAQRRR